MRNPFPTNHPAIFTSKKELSNFPPPLIVDQTITLVYTAIQAGMENCRGLSAGLPGSVAKYSSTFTPTPSPHPRGYPSLTSHTLAILATSALLLPFTCHILPSLGRSVHPFLLFIFQNAASSLHRKLFLTSHYMLLYSLII